MPTTKTKKLINDEQDEYSSPCDDCERNKNLVCSECPYSSPALNDPKEYVGGEI